MRFFLIKLDDNPIAVVAHEYKDGGFYCRSNSESFRRAFDVVCKRTDTKYVKDDNQLRLYAYDSREQSWIDNVLDKTCNEPWNSEELKVDHTVSFENLVDEYLID